MTDSSTKPKVLGLIPARGGSQRVKNKNIQLLGQKPLLAYTIEAALRSKHIDRVIVSTDSEDIRKIALAFGAEAPFLRPSDIAGAAATELEFHQHALNWLKENESYTPEWIVNLYPTTPFRTTASIDRAMELVFAHPEADSLRSLRPVSEHPCKMWTVEGERALPYVQSDDTSIHTAAYHTLPRVFIQNASIYIVRASVVTELKSTIGRHTLALEMSEEESVDINSPIDFKFAEHLLSEKLSALVGSGKPSSPAAHPSPAYPAAPLV